MTAAELKARVAQTVDAHAAELEALARQIFAQPELGFKEHRTARVVHEWFDRLGLKHSDGIALTGTRRPDLRWRRADDRDSRRAGFAAVLGASRPGSQHGRRARLRPQCAGGDDARGGLALREVAPELAGRVALIAVPAEEYVELEERLAFRDQGQLEFLGGKAEMVRLGAFDDVDAAMMVHTTARPEDGDLAVGGTNNGMVAKFVRFLGRTSHAGGAPDQGINALSAARVALAGIDAVRETFRDEDHIRVHPIVTRGGDVVNAIPADVRLEMFCRGATVEAIELAHRKVDRALKAGALALGGAVEITTLAGYLPLFHDPNLVGLFRNNARDIVGAGNVREKATAVARPTWATSATFCPRCIPTLAEPPAPATAPTTASSTTPEPSPTPPKRWP